MKYATGFVSKLAHPKDQFKSWKIVRGDTVQILWGKDKGKKGTVLKVYRKKNRVMVEGLNLVKKHIPSRAGRKGGIITKAGTVHVSAVSLVDPTSGKPTKVRFGFVEPEKLPNGGQISKVNTKNGTMFKVRISKKTGVVIPSPAILKKRRHKIRAGKKDTTSDIAIQKTYDPETERERIVRKIMGDKAHLFDPKYTPKETPTPPIDSK